MPNRRALPLVIVLSVLGCGPSPEPEPEPVPSPDPEPTTEGGEAQLQEPAPQPEPVSVTEPATPPGPTAEEIAAAVEARVAGMPAPPIDGTRQLSTVTRAEGRRVCRWMTRIQGSRRQAECPDGSTVTVGGSTTCNPAQYAEFEGCSVTLFEMAACFAGMGAAPCEAGMLGANLPECQPFLGCVRQQMERAQQQQPPPPVETPVE